MSKNKTEATQRWRGMLILLVVRIAKLLRIFEARMLVWAFGMPYMRVHPTSEDAPILADGERISMKLAGKSICGWRFGKGEKLVLLMHGWAGSSAQLAAWIPGLLERGFSVIAVDTPAHGVSPGLRTGLRESAAVLVELGEQVGPLAGIVAHSWGCMNVTRALQSGLRAERVVLVAPPTGVEYYFEKYLGIIRLPKKRWPNAKKSVEAYMQGVPIKELNAGPMWSGRKTPLFVVHDKGDREVDFASHQQWLEEVPHAEGMITEGLSHRRIIRSPEVIAAGLAFLNDEATATESISAGAEKS